MTLTVKPVKKTGGARPGAGRKTANKIKNELKSERTTLRLYPSQRKHLELMYGSVQAALDSIPVVSPR